MRMSHHSFRRFPAYLTALSLDIPPRLPGAITVHAKKSSGFDMIRQNWFGVSPKNFLVTYTLVDYVDGYRL